MGRMLGAFDHDSDSERADLNLCPDCGCYFPQANCPLCGKECPEEFRAGNRVQKKKKKTKRSTSSRVTFVEWYHTWWVIALALIFVPILGIILLITSPHKRSLKITLVVIAVLYSILSSYGFILVASLRGMFEKPVNTSLSMDEYTALCEEVDAEAYYRTPSAYEGKYIRMNLTVVQKLVDSEDYNGKYSLYYLCKSSDGGNFTILIRDCIQEDSQNFLPGDHIVIYGEGAEARTILDEMTWEAYSAPCIHVAYYAPIK